MDRLPAGGPSAPASPHAQRRRQAVRDAVASALTERQREAVELYFFEGLSQAQIAARLGVSQQVVHRRIHGARRGGRVVGGALARLRAALSELLDPTPAHAHHDERPNPRETPRAPSRAPA